MRCYNARRCGFLVAASLEYDAVEQNDGSNFAFEYDDTAMLNYRSPDISASTFWQALLPFTWRWFAALQTRPQLPRLPHAAPRRALPTRETDHYIKSRERGSTEEKKEEPAQAGWPPRLSWRRPPRLSWRPPPRLSWCLHTY